MGKTLLRIYPLGALKTATKKNLCGSDRGRYWALDEAQIAELKMWAAEMHVKFPSRVVTPKAPKVRKPQTVTPPPGYVARKARVHPVAVRETLGDCDYLDKLSPEERAWKDQFDRETILNRWYDREGVKPFFARGSEERRVAQFNFNRKYDDLYNARDWWAQSLETADVNQGIKRLPSRYKVAGDKQFRSYADILPDTGAATEDALIDTIDRSRE